MHTGDDAVAVKASNFTGPAPDCCDIVVINLLAINNSSTAKVGTETVGAHMERISFKNVCAVRTVRLCAVDAYDNAAIRDVSWTNCYVHHLPTNWHNPFLIDIQAPLPANHSASMPPSRLPVDLNLNASPPPNKPEHAYGHAKTTTAPPFLKSPAIL